MAIFLEDGRCYEAEICAILLLLRCPFRWYLFVSKSQNQRLLFRLFLSALILTVVCSTLLHQQEKTFLSVEKKGSDGNFSVVYTDASWETK